jgi:hypothetical protein
MPDWGQRLRSKVTKAISRPVRPDTYQGLRSMVLALDLSTLAMPDGTPWGGAAVALMEIGLPRGTASIVAVADGSVSMYVTTGGGVIGAGAHPAVRAVAERFRTVAAESRDQLRRSGEFPLPAPGEVRFQVRTMDGDYSGAASEAALRAGRHPLTALYRAGQDLLTEIRLSAPD